MPRPRTPREKARITGADRNPLAPTGIHWRRPESSVPICSAICASYRAARRAVELDERWTARRLESDRREVPWLMESDRALVEIASYLRARLMAGEDVGAGAMNQLRMCAAQMGATPADRSKVAVPAEPDDDPADRFFN